VNEASGFTKKKVTVNLMPPGVKTWLPQKRKKCDQRTRRSKELKSALKLHRSEYLKKNGGREMKLY